MFLSKQAEEFPAQYDRSMWSLATRLTTRFATLARMCLSTIYAPWSGHGKQIAPIGELRAARYTSVDHIRIAKMDGTANEGRDIRIDKNYFPIFLLHDQGWHLSFIRLPRLRAYLKSQNQVVMRRNMV